MKIEELVDERNKELYDEIQAHYQIKLKQSKDSSWSSQVIGKTLIIEYADTDHPIGAFTHELLHPFVQMKGYKRIRAGVSLDWYTHSQLGTMCTFLDNQFQHYKMFGKFTELAFPDNEFYNDDDASTATNIEAFLSNSGQTLITMSMQYIRLNAPGGSISNEKRKELKQKFFEHEGEKYKSEFEEIDKILEDWINDASFDAEKYYMRLFKTIKTGKIWISYDDSLNGGLSASNFPLPGFFGEQTFTLQDIQQHFATKP